MIFEDAPKYVVNKSKVILIVNKLKDSLGFLNEYGKSPTYFGYEARFGIPKKEAKKDYLGFESDLFNRIGKNGKCQYFTIYNKKFNIIYVDLAFYEDGKFDLLLWYPRAQPVSRIYKNGEITIIWDILISGRYGDFHEIEHFLQHFAECKTPEDVVDFCPRGLIKKEDLIKYMIQNDQ